MSDLATIEMREGPARISREHVKRRIYIGFNVVGRDIGGVVDEGRAKACGTAPLAGRLYRRVGWGVREYGTGQRAAHDRRCPSRWASCSFCSFGPFTHFVMPLLIILNLPFSLIGGVVSLWMSGQYLSVPASIGFIELFGLAVGNGIILVSYINHLRHEGKSMDEAILTGCSLRLRPVVMTMMTTLLGLLPLALAKGSEQRSSGHSPASSSGGSSPRQC